MRGLTPELRAVATEDHPVEYYDVGRGPTLVMVHGGSCSADDWFPLLSRLADGYRVVLPDGLIHPLDPWRVWRLLDHLGIDRTALLGHSAGGALIREMYRLEPTRVWGFISLDSSAAVVPGSMTLARRLPNSHFSAVAAALYQTNQDAMEALRPHHRGDCPSEVTIRCRRRAYGRQALTAQERRRAEGRAAPEPKPISAPPRLCPRPIGDLGQFIQCPTLIYQTGRGKLGPEAISDAWQAQNVQAREAQYIVIREAGHWFWLESEDLLLETLVPFLARHAR